MKFPKAGMKLQGFVISEKEAGVVTVKMTPLGISEYLDTKAFSFLKLYLFSVPLYVVICDKVPKVAPPTIEWDDKMMCGPVLIFGREDGLRSLNDSELDLIRDSIDMEKCKGDCILLLKNMSAKAENWAVVDA